jgi:uncharacterized protein (TIGR00159 family)
MIATIFLLKILFLDLSIWDVFDILIVGWLLSQLYQLLRGSIAINIFIGLLLVYGLWWLVDILNMDTLSLILGQFVSIGMIALLIVFQPEVRRFLVVLGRSLNQQSGFLGRLFRNGLAIGDEAEQSIIEITKALHILSKTKTGALLVFTDNPNLQVFTNSGILLNATISTQLLISLFNKESPLHDGAVIIANDKIISASCVLPVSESFNLPENAGLRHRAALGISENTESLAVIVSEETGKISYTREGKIVTQLTPEHIGKVLSILFKERSSRKISTALSAVKPN